MSMLSDTRNGIILSSEIIITTRYCAVIIAVADTSYEIFASPAAPKVVECKNACL